MRKLRWILGDQLASLLQRQGKLGEATEMQRRLLKLRRETLGPSHVDTLRSSDCLASMLRQDQPLEAYQLLKDALEPLGELRGESRALLG